MLASDLAVNDTLHQTTGPMNWFESFQDVDRVSPESLADVDKSLPAGIAGPVEPAVGEWIVQLTDSAAKPLRSLDQANSLFNQAYGDFTIISGLGVEGLLLVRGRGATKSVLESSLSQNENVQSFSLNQLIEGKSTTPNDPEFVAGLMPGMEKIDATNAWDVSRGSSSTVVGVVDGGIDPTHPDLYLNIWVNQGELPTKYLDDVGPKLTDIDGDGLITFYDLNNVTRATTSPYAFTFNGFANGPNASFVVDKNSNGRIDAEDLLADPNWADGFDTDNNGFFDDFFGVNFRAGSGDPFAANNPSDELGHGTHVAGTIGAIGGNAAGVVGVNWQTSLMSLRILDNNNQGDSGAAIRAINYAREMRERYRVEPNGRVSEGANVRVLNNSWGQPGGYEVSLETAIQDSTDAGILFVAASGNGNFLGQGVDNDRTPFYPAGYNTVLAVAASDSSDRPATFSNFGIKSVDIFAPGVGIRSTLSGGGIGSANGTSMASPHVAGTAALIWSAFPAATVDEVQLAILSTVDPITNGSSFVSTGGRLNASKAINADVFAPAARLVSKQNITSSGGASTEFTVEYSHRSGIDTTSIGNEDLIVTRQWGPADQLVATLKPNSITTTVTTARATYIVSAPGGTWDPLDFGDYVISTVAGRVAAKVGGKTTEARDVGLFNVRIIDPSFLYVTTYSDSLEQGTLRSQIIAANAAAPSPRTIILESGLYSIDVPPTPDFASKFPTPSPQSQCFAPAVHSAWSNEASGDFDVIGSITVIGNQKDTTIINGKSFDRVFKVHPDATFNLQRATITGGVSPTDQGGGGILSAGNLSITDSIIRGNRAKGIEAISPIGGGGVAVWSGQTNISSSWIDDNDSNLGGGVFYCGASDGNISQSTISNNRGGGVQGSSSKDLIVSNSTISTNVGGNGAIADFNGVNDAIRDPSISADSRFIAFSSKADNLVPGDTNGIEDIFVFDRNSNVIERVSMANDGSQESNFSFQPSISADGRFVAFGSYAENFVPGDTNDTSDIFVYDRQQHSIQCVTLGINGAIGNSDSFYPSISADGRYVVYSSSASNLVTGDTNGKGDTFIFDTVRKTTERVTGQSGAESTGGGIASISSNGQFIAFSSFEDNLSPLDMNGSLDEYVYDRISRQFERISFTATSTQSFVNESGNQTISADGRYVSFDASTSLVPEDINGKSDVYVYDRTNHSLELISKGLGGQMANGESSVPSISPGGRFVAFTSTSSNLVLNDSNNTKDIFIFDRTLRTLERVNDANNGIYSSNADSLFENLQVSLSDDGRFGVFASVGDKLDINLLDRNSQQIRPAPFDQGFSTIRGTELTLVGETLTRFSVSGSVDLVDTIISGTNADLGSQVSFKNVLQDSSPGVSFLGKLDRIGTAPPVHLLLRGNPAIDQGSILFSGSRDQLGVLRGKPDIGAVEVVDANVSGLVYIDSNRNQLFDDGETTIPDVQVRLQSPLSIRSAISNAAGVFKVEKIDPGKLTATVSLPKNFTKSVPVTQRIPPTFVPNKSSFFGGLSSDGRFVAFESDATNLVPNDTNNTRDLFLYDRQGKTVIRVAENAAFSSPSVSPDGGFVVYNSILYPSGMSSVFAYNVLSSRTELIGGGSGAKLSNDGRFVVFSSQGLFVYNRDTQVTEQQNITTTGGLPNDFINHSSISDDGRYIVFDSLADNLVASDINLHQDVFLYDRVDKKTTIVSANAMKVQGNGDSLSPSISADGRYVVFLSDSTNLIESGTKNVRNVFVFDRITGSLELVSKSSKGAQGDDFSSTPSISSDGRFVSYGSDATNLVDGDTNRNRDIFLFDRSSTTTLRLNLTDGEQQRGFSFAQSMSADGSLVVYEYFPNTNDSDRDGPSDVYVAANPLTDANRSRIVSAGDIVTDLNLGLAPDPGTISGRVYEDSILENGNYDQGETGLAGWTVYVDENNNGVQERTEQFGITNNVGVYQLSNMPGYKRYTIRAVAQSGFVQIAPLSGSNDLFLSAGGTIGDRDFGFQRVQSSGQSSGSSVSGRLYDDRNGNGLFDAGDVPIANREVYLDAANFGVRDSNEPRVLTDSQGFYSIDGLSSRTVAVTTTLDASLVHVSPLGSQFSLQKYPLFAGITPFANPQAIVSGDFNLDGYADVAIALAEANKLSIRLNDKKGGFLPDPIDIDLGKDGVGPASLVIGQFDNDPKLDVALTAKLSSKVIVLLNFNPTTKTFASQSAVTVGLQPTDIVVGQFGGDSKLDLVVVNQGSASVKGDSTVQVLTNNGSGVFTAGPPVPTGGDDSISLTAANFAGDTSLDVAVVHAAPANTSTPNGGVTILVGNGAGGLSLQSTFYQTGALPIDSSTADFNGDGRADLAVANFSSNSISILIGQSNGTFRVQTAILGTASGAFDITVGDIDDDGDIDVIASNLIDRNISIFRNIGVDATNGDVRFEPLENVGLGQFAQAQRMPLVVGNFDNDTSGPGGKGTLDIVTIPQATDTIHVLKNRLVNGTHRVLLTGTNKVTDMDFIIKNAILPPSFNDISSPAPIVEDATEQLIELTGIKKGRATGPALRFAAISSVPGLISNPVVTYLDGNTGATLRYASVANANGTAIITVQAIDAGADQTFNTTDDGSFERSITVTVLAVNDPPTFLVPSLTTVTQKEGAQSIANFVSSLSPGLGSDEANQALSSTIVVSDPSLFTIQPAINGAGILTFTPNRNQSGITPITISYKDNGGIANSGVDTATKNFVIQVLPVNDAPSFSLQGNLSAQVGSGLQTKTGFAFGFSPGGGPDEASQIVLDYLVTVDSPGLFVKLPVIDSAGTLTFTPAADRSGIASVSVRVRDSGGISNGGVDLSPIKSFTITVGLSQTLTLNAAEIGPHEIAIRNGMLVVTAGGNTINSVPVVDLQKVTINDRSGARLFEVTAPASNLPGTIRYTGIGRPIELVSEQALIDLSSLTPDKLFGVQIVDLRLTGVNSFVFKPTDVSSLNATKTLRFIMDKDDKLATQSVWKSQTGTAENGVWVQPYTSGDARIEVISTSPWQNKVNLFDIDGDQAASPLDVLALINLINAGSGGALPVRGSIGLGTINSFIDPDGDNTLGPLDVLTVINQLNRGSGADGESTDAMLYPFSTQSIDQVMAVDLSDLFESPTVVTYSTKSSRRQDKR